MASETLLCRIRHDPRAILHFLEEVDSADDQTGADGELVIRLADGRKVIIGQVACHKSLTAAGREGEEEHNYTSLAIRER